MSCSGRFAEADEYDAVMCAELDLSDAALVAKVELILDIAASDIHAAMAASDSCDCTLASWAAVYLKKLNIVDAAVLHNCPCVNNLTYDEREAKRLWIEDQLEQIRTGKLPLCEDDHGSEYPAVATAEHSWTGWNAEQILANELSKNP